MTQRSLLKAIESDVLPILRSFGYKVSHNLESDSFDNAVVELTSEPLKIRFIRERGQVFLDVASTAPAAEWYDLDLVTRALGRPRDDAYALPASRDSIQQLANGLISNHAKILELLGPEGRWVDLVDRMNELRERRSNERLGPL